MRLINAKTKTLDEFFESVTPQYAILSHTWDDGEVRFQDMTATPASSRLQGLAGYSKIEETCRLALEHGLEWAWVDTCCIDKSSSAELTEAINSMFRWYQNAHICFVFLSDLNQLPDLAKCRWFTRGWTLQEMLAPARIEFYSQTWTSIGTKETLLPQLSTMAGIREAALTGAIPLSSLTIAEKMAWAAHRCTTRSEDLAYCLFGLFDVNMPLIYGEGNNAFRRLQEEMIRRSNDLTIFAWEPSPRTPWHNGLFATSPRDFAVYRDKFPNLTHMGSHDLGVRGVRPEYTLTNSGLRLHASLQLLPCYNDSYLADDRGETYILKLGSVKTSSQAHDTTLAITLLKIGAGLFLRRDRLLKPIAHENGVPLYPGTAVINAHVNTIALSDNTSTKLARIRNLEQSVNICPEGPDVNHYDVSHAIPEILWDRTTRAFFCPPSTTHVSAVLVDTPSVHVTLLVIIDRRRGPYPLLVDWDNNRDPWQAWFFQERHARELPTWYDLRYHVSEGIESLSASITLEPRAGDPDRSPIKVTATLQPRDISLHDFQDFKLPRGAQLPPGLAPRYQLVIETTRKNGNDKTLEEVGRYG